MAELNNWKSLREDARFSLRRAAQLANMSPSFLCVIEKGGKCPVNTAIALSRLYQREVVLMEWLAPTYDTREYLSWRLTYDPDESTFTCQYYDDDDCEWIIDGDCHAHITHGFVIALGGKP